ncbi:MAG: hypothetical protein ABI663_13490 [Chryseolinea sp.]
MSVFKLVAGISIVVSLGMISSCQKDPEPFDCELTDLTIKLNGKSDATNCTTPDGSIVVEANAGKEPYTFFLNNETIGQPTGDFMTLAPGIYSVSVKDGNGCVKSVNNIAIVGANFSFSTTILEDNLCLGGNGEASITVVDGNPPYTFNIAGGAFSGINSFIGLSSGNHSIGVKDVNGCTVNLSITIPRGKSDTSWSNDVRPIVQASCANSGCHDGASRPDLRVYTNAEKFATQMKTETRNRNMPREGTLTQSQIDLIGCWVDDGALNN